MATEETKNTTEGGSLLDQFSEDANLDKIDKPEDTPDPDNDDKDNDVDDKPEEKKNKKEDTPPNPEDFDDDPPADDDLIKSEEERNQDDDPPVEESIWTDVEKLTGYNIDVDWGEVDPDTPEGVAKYLESYGSSVQENTLKQLEKNFPKQYQMIMHQANGGNLNDLIDASEPDFSEVSFQEDNAEDMIDFLSYYYTEHSNLGDEEAQAVVENAVKNGTLFQKANAELKKLQDLQESKRAEAYKKQEERAQELRQQDNAMVQTLSGVISKGEVADFNIPNAEREEFTRYVLQSVRRDPDNPTKYAVVQMIDEQDLAPHLQTLYFGFKKGDLSKIVQKRAKTESVRRLKRNASKDNGTSSSGSARNSDKRRRAQTSMDDFNA